MKMTDTAVVNPQNSGFINVFQFQKSEEQITIRKKVLVNKINFLNFKGEVVSLVFESTNDGKVIFLQAYPQPCTDSGLICYWKSANIDSGLLAVHRFRKLLLPEKKQALGVTLEIKKIDSDSVHFHLPETCVIVKSYESICDIEFYQGDIGIKGCLVQLKPFTIAVLPDSDPPRMFKNIDPESTIRLSFLNNGEVVFESEFQIIKMEQINKINYLNVEPVNDIVPRFPAKLSRSIRVAICPTPEISFLHPFDGKLVRMTVVDLSGSGFSAATKHIEVALFAGMEISDIKLIILESIEITCDIQVVHRTIEKNGKNTCDVTYGFAFTKMSFRDFTKIQEIVHQAEYPNARVCNIIDMDELWQFFFESGFIYSTKYRIFNANKNNIKETYKTLYTKNPEIAKHFIHLEDGQIMGHISMLQFYENTWLIHHHAALTSTRIKAGVLVLRQISNFIYNTIWNPACHMEYLICYFRPENRFPAYFFGQYAIEYKNPKACSTDTFIYTTYQKNKSNVQLPNAWKLSKASTLDLVELKQFYKQHSGGLLINAFNLNKGNTESRFLEEKYNKLGLQKEQYVYSLKSGNQLKAVFLVNTSDFSINMSDLTNSVQIIVVDSEDLPKENIHHVLDILSHHFRSYSFPILIYPESYAQEESISYEKRYVLWVMKTAISDPYFKHVNKIINRVSAQKNKSRRPN